ncbi:MAG: tRNA (adenosine(37)-N6)-threonylcarbamoyltransferase complex dimerization subunit type 1 TsaB [Deltaproteobacteria bacterium RIFCSPLOWO2_12_FULL_43_16]|nr:MAG: tRNA (adenosine(37)-N6)-threonylcarbamoyltransferase complex dimerization subunit type 1 TsaB [Deltaproteobacteria bacterium GWA2_43_19]OGQ10671.1 MAG: tRNA (adenosine(37)-N6)-threonylcarbamoyltransferase complex dimerization subunit type 1 TsaB [Deltaproteobacteria bacterium RIFCSPHIGHO2_02_FULL_43_33]OGQ38632.1 MAG: tRNA (adenosine(37)-N6)-threonylcarbamoyltransferase complex dimerization subunit type 1 TsaB [Deltaproteobacteria bacterium RIFCSPLOWO2_01_FULL_42_9]OGQ58652.1 MAG: tRNA (
MKILAIDTSTASGSIALLEDNQLIAETTTHIQKTHAERLLPSIKNLFDTIGARIEEVDGFALTTGPGSFTGLRIGLSTIKGLAWSLNKPVVGVSTLEAMAMNIPYADKPICPVLDARKKEVYAGIYKFQDAECSCIMPDTAISPTALIERIQEPTIFIGDGIQVFKSQISNLKSQILIAPPHLWPIKASNIGLLAWEKFKSGLVDKPDIIRLNYLRPSEAEIKKTVSGKS